jgi:RNA polymerase primary sigma factor
VSRKVSICKRIEEAELQLKQVIYSFGFTAKEHIALAEKLISEPPKERFDRVIIDKKLEVREGHLKELRHLVKAVRQLDRQADLKYASWQDAAKKTQPRRLAEYQKLDKKLQTSFPNFCYKQKVIEEMMNVASNIHEKILLSQRTIHELERHSHGSHAKAMVKSSRARSRLWKASCACRWRSSTTPTTACASTRKRRTRPRPKWLKRTCVW